jgi:hypothetical protein
MVKTEKRGAISATLIGFGLIATALIESLVKRPVPAEQRNGRLTHPDVMFEPRDVNAKMIGWVAVLIVVAAFLIHAIVAASYGYFSRTEFRNRQPVTLVQQATHASAVPSLQENPGHDLERLQQSQQKILNSYGWIDRSNGVARIPIQEAMKQVLDKGLPPAEKASPSPVSGSKIK